jgi:hypothetical protein
LIILSLDDIHETFAKAPFCPIPASGSNFNPQNTQCIPVVKIFAFLGLEQNWTFFKGLLLLARWQAVLKKKSRKAWSLTRSIYFLFLVGARGFEPPTP